MTRDTGIRAGRKLRLPTDLTRLQIHKATRAELTATVPNANHTEFTISAEVANDAARYQPNTTSAQRQTPMKYSVHGVPYCNSMLWVSCMLPVCSVRVLDMISFPLLDFLCALTS